MFNFVQHFEQRVAEFEQECARLERGARGLQQVVMLGDSLTEVNQALPGWVNRGISSDHLQWGECDVFERLGHNRLHPNPTGIVILLGINDLNDDPAAVEHHISIYGYLLSTLALSYPSAKLAVASLLPTCGPATHLNKPIVEFNARLRELSTARDALYFDLHSLLYDTSAAAARPEFLLQGDGIHVAKKGYRVINEYLTSRSSDFIRHVGPPASEIKIDSSRLSSNLMVAYGRDCWVGAESSADDAEVAAAFVKPEVDYLLNYAQSKALPYANLYLGSRVKFSKNGRRLWGPDAPSSIAADQHILLDNLLAQNPSQHVLATLTSVHNQLAQHLTPAKTKPIRLLFIGDCLLEDVELLLGGELIRHGLLVDVDYIVSKNPMEQLREIRAARETKYDAVVYSPFSWQFDQDFQEVLTLRPIGIPALKRLTQVMLSRAEKVIALLADGFECNVYVHNTAAVIRASSDTKRVARSIGTFYKRRYVRKRIAKALERTIKEANSRSIEHLFMVDELAEVSSMADDFNLGRCIYYSDAIHPTELSYAVTKQIASNVASAARLGGKKVVVCDLDNTLWDGVIGEGLPVRQCKDRQRILRILKSRGVILAICSKNDPVNIRWDGALLSADDFVASAISWDHKSAGIARIQRELNLKAKDFVFIDDRADERAMLAEAFPEMLCLDPCTEGTWDLLRTWAHQLASSASGDRTEMYRQRVERQKLLDEHSGEEDAVEMFKRIQLVADIRRSTESDLKRIHELINRTNQWNIQGSRCTFSEVAAWHQSANHYVYSVRVKDKFGDMGLICACVAEVTADALDLQVFVLSCRVFGYGIETLLLRQLERDSSAKFGRTAVRGRILETPHNKPCRAMFSQHGYQETDGLWHSTDDRGTAPAPTWFQRVSIQP